MLGGEGLKRFLRMFITTRRVVQLFHGALTFSLQSRGVIVVMEETRLLVTAWKYSAVVGLLLLIVYGELRCGCICILNQGPTFVLLLTTQKHMTE